MKYKLVCIDIDGTLLDSNKKLPLENKLAINYAYKNNVKIAIASGRSPMGIKDLIDELGIKAYEICLNGALVKSEDIVIKKEIIAKNQVNKICDVILKYNVCAFFSTEKLNITNKKLGLNIQNSVVKQKNYIISSNDAIRSELMKHDILKVSIYEPKVELYEEVRKVIEKSDSLSAVSSDINYLDINIKNVNKSSGVKSLAKYIDVELSEVICIGDNENDIDMIKDVGLGVAMANACEELLEVCDYVTTSNDECGVAKVVKDYIIESERGEWDRDEN